jgi:hypothetical protein
MLVLLSVKDSALLTLLDDSGATLGPGLISIPDIINKIYNTKNRYLHISITELSESKVGSGTKPGHHAVTSRRLCSLVFLVRPSGIT